MVVEALQTRTAALDEDNAVLGTFPMRGGVTLLVSQQPLRDDGTRPEPEIRYVIHNHLSPERERRQRMNYFASALVPHYHGEEDQHHRAHADDESHFQINFGLIHGGLDHGCEEEQAHNKACPSEDADRDAHAASPIAAQQRTKRAACHAIEARTTKVCQWLSATKCAEVGRQRHRPEWGSGAHVSRRLW
jgi:hypothetical protein